VNALSQRRAARGFTLLEVIVSMTILALVTGICYAAFHLGIRAVSKGEVAVVTAQRLRVATDVLIRQVKSASSAGAGLDDDYSPFYFVGKPNLLSFVTEAGQLSGGGPSWVKYTITSDPPQIVLQECPCFDAKSLADGACLYCDPISAVVLDGFLQAQFEFNDPNEDGECGKDGWCKSWDYVEMEMLPLAVRLSVRGLPGLEQDDWGQEIPLMAATYGDELPEPPRDCEGFDKTGTSSSGSSTGKSSSKPQANGGGDGDDGDDNDDGDD
jgi:prepilin-type N-terminal cleavage/methylation domain-containing protein